MLIKTLIVVIYSYANRWITPDHESAAVNITTEELPSNTRKRERERERLQEFGL